MPLHRSYVEEYRKGGKPRAMAHANDREAIELAAAKLPLVRGKADISASRSGPGKVTVMHRSTGRKIGHVESADGGYRPVHASGAKAPPAPHMAAALSGLIAMHNKIARGKDDAGMAAAKAYANGEQLSLDLALPVSTPAVSSMDGPRVTSMAGGKPALHPAVKAVYGKLRKKGMPHPQALKLAKRAAAMRARASAKAA
jgi:hypothetical protein